ncbi:hypothetical protein B566_EDAN002786 [Ephemera danica]|nr:hypothetical protein B566_EDAN002786 [Ephemera danica]
MENNDVHVKVAVAPSSENRIINHLGTVTLVPKHIPYQYDHLKNVVEQKKKWDLHKTHIRNEVSSASAVAVLFGATIASPKQIYIMEFPQLLEPSTSAIPSRRCLIHLFREFMTSETVQQTAARTLSPSNVYVFLRKPAKNQESWFCMKEQYSMSNRCNKVSLKFCQPPSVGQPKFKIYLDSGSSECPSPMCKSVAPHEPAECPVEASAWYQAQKFVHGFKDCWIGDQCATDLWMKI